MFQLFELSAPLRGTALGLYVTTKHIGITIIIDTWDGFITAFAKASNDVFTAFWLIQLSSQLAYRPFRLTS